MAPALQQYKFLHRLADVGTGRLPANSTLQQGRYLLIATIGKGGMGAVYLTHDTQMSNRQVAIKEMSQVRLKDPGELQRARERFQQEADILSGLSHPSLPRVYHSFQERDRSYLVMDYIKGEPLYDLLRKARGAALSIEDTVSYGLQLAEVLAYLHDCHPPIVFHDLKPSNVMVRDNQQICLIDFGIARFFHKDRHHSTTEVFVSQGYAPPEQYVGRATPQSDLFSLGATLHFCLTGQNPGGHTKERLFEFLPAEVFNPLVPAELSDLVQCLLAVDPQQRPATAHDVIRELRRIQISLRNPVRLHHDTTFDPITATSRADGSTSSPAVPSKQNGLFPWLAGIGAGGVAIFHGLASSLRGNRVPIPGVQGRPAKKYVGEILADFWQEQASQVIALRGNARVWKRQFTLFFLAVVTLTIGGGIYLLKTAPDAGHITGLLLLIVLLSLSGFYLFQKHLTDPVPRSLLGMISATFVLAILMLQALPDVGSVIHTTLQTTTLNQLIVITLLILGVLCVFRPTTRLAWTDKVLLGLLALCGALQQYGFGMQELPQISVLPADSLMTLNAVLIWTLVALAFLSLLRSDQLLGGWSRFSLVIVAIVLALSQYTSGFQELQHFLISGQPSVDDIQRLIVFSFLCTWIPLGSALLALFFPRPWTIRPALGTAALVSALVLSYRGLQISFPFFPTTSDPLSINVLAVSTLYQLIGPLLVLVAGIALFRLPGKRPFSALDHVLLLLGTLICTMLDNAYWQSQVTLTTIQMSQGTLNQQFIKIAGLIPVGAMYIVLVLLGLSVLMLVGSYLRGQSNSSQRLTIWIGRFHGFILRMERLLALILVGSTLILQGFAGTLKSVSLYGVNWLSAGDQPDLFSLLVLLLTFILSISGLVFLFQLFARRPRELGRNERLAICLSSILCLLLISQNSLFAGLPLLEQSISFTGNLLHWSTGTLNLLLLVGLLLAPLLAWFWIRRLFFVRYYELLRFIFILVMVCAFLQLLWPVFLPLGLIILTPALLLTIQIEHAG